jgi:hypothetical protein
VREDPGLFGRMARLGPRQATRVPSRAFRGWVCGLTLRQDRGLQRSRGKSVETTMTQPGCYCSELTLGWRWWPWPWPSPTRR